MELNYIIIPFVAIATGAVGSYFTFPDVGLWYSTLKKPRWTPPGWTFGVAWTIIYGLSAASALIVWNATPRGPRFWTTIFVFLLNAMLNAGWSYFFFRKHEMRLAFYESLALDLTIAVLIALIWPVSTVAAYLLAPYLVWVTFATFLARAVWKLNQ